MARISHVTYSCEKCGKKLKADQNSLNIVTSLSEASYWSRLHVKIEHTHGVHNNETKELADLCRGCAIILLTDALKRVRKGERATAGVEGIEEGKW